MSSISNIGSAVAAQVVPSRAGRPVGSAAPGSPAAMQVARAEIEYVSEEVQRESLEQAEPRTSTTNQAAAQRDQLGEAMAKFNRSVNFKVDQDTGVDVMTVRDRSTGEVVRQYPPKEFLTLVSRLEEMRGVFFEEVA